ncbi:molybdenum cofactor guanylyltransferase [Rhodobacter sp. JA431]|uniref:molybdenum cofactor guanylyltransferase MobA n=1 Tax=Rhodobacter sp. JA431 TaxID=570013 RepID=UPI000BCF31BD|nr:molybdenum cofactor guanylyltransferase MobA [Rhodobacter sp. JA431]SOB93407.1 molybdenum cofactor guanylyltransferase [Rhodobacter sp. JA431]
MRIAGLVLAGGSGQRMGAEKALITLGGQTLVSHVVARLAPQVKVLALSANGDPARFDDLGLPVLADPEAELGAGPMVGVRAGLRWADAEGAQALVTVAVDTPFLPTNLAVRLLATGGAAYAKNAGRAHYTAALWLTADLARFDRLFETGERRMRPYLEGAHVVDFPGTPDPFTNINTQADLARAEAALGGGAV